MANTRFFDLDGFFNYLNSNYDGSLHVHSNGLRCDGYLDSPQYSSFQVSEHEFLENHSITVGAFSGGIWEEMRLRIGSPKRFHSNVQIPAGKYRVRVEKKEGSDVCVKTYIRRMFGWREQDLPFELPLSRILKRDL